MKLLFLKSAEKLATVVTDTAKKERYILTYCLLPTLLPKPSATPIYIYLGCSCSLQSNLHQSRSHRFRIRLGVDRLDRLHLHVRARVAGPSSLLVCLPASVGKGIVAKNFDDFNRKLKEVCEKIKIIAL